jgi:hypothetical protein
VWRRYDCARLFAPAYCGDNFDAPGPAYVLRATITLDHTATRLNLTGGSAGFDPVVYVSTASRPCGTNADCSATGDISTPINIADAVGNVQSGDWFIIVTAASIDADGACGPFSLNTDGGLPVSLQSFVID